MTSSYFHDTSLFQTEIQAPKKVLAIGAHPDDIEFGAGGTLSKWAEAKTELVFAILTDGSKGTWNPNANPLELALLRQQEQLEAARTISSDAVVEFLGWTDGELQSDSKQVSQACYLIRKYRPDVVVGHDPWKRYRLHPDHRNAGLVLTDAVVAARDPHFLKELGLHHRPSAILLFEADEPNYCESLSLSQIENKVQALLCHKSQHETSMEIAVGANHEVEAFRDQVIDAAVRVGEPYGHAYGETFRLMTEI